MTWQTMNPSQTCIYEVAFHPLDSLKLKSRVGCFETTLYISAGHIYVRVQHNYHEDKEPNGTSSVTRESAFAYCSLFETKWKVKADFHVRHCSSETWLLDSPWLVRRGSRQPWVWGKRLLLRPRLRCKRSQLYYRTELIISNPKSLGDWPQRDDAFENMLWRSSFEVDSHRKHVICKISLTYYKQANK